MPPLEAEKVAGGNDAASRSLADAIRQRVCDGEGSPSDLRISREPSLDITPSASREGGKPRRMHPS